MSLPTNYRNEILNSAMSNRRQYRMIENNNNTISFIDVTVYDQEGSLFDADDINAITTQINLNITNIAAIEQAIQSGLVTGVKGNDESSYRAGQVNITAANIGTYSKTEIDNLIDAIGGMHFELVNALPTENISTSTIYLVPSENARSRNTKDEYINLDGTTSGWEQIGSTSVNLSNYYTKSEIDSGALITTTEFEAI